MKKLFSTTIVSVLMLCGYTNYLSAHCQVPCGIYDDELRFEYLREDFDTLQKAMNEITELSKAGDKNYNQIVRWIDTKTDHSEKINKIVTYYFMTQRIKPKKASDTEAYARYQQQLVLLQKILIHTMKAQQTNDLSHITSLRELLDSFRTLYYGKENLDKVENHHNHDDAYGKVHTHK